MNKPIATHAALKVKVKRVRTLFMACIREIFDESAYARFLLRQQIAPSCEAYAAFLRENGAARERRPRCC
jgi:hypothetical protein